MDSAKKILYSHAETAKDGFASGQISFILKAMDEWGKQCFEMARKKYVDPISEDADREHKFETYNDYKQTLKEI